MREKNPPPPPPAEPQVEWEHGPGSIKQDMLIIAAVILMFWSVC